MEMMNILHLSDLHFRALADAESWYHPLAEDLHYDLSIKKIDCLILSGDITNTATPEEYSAAGQFLEKLCKEFLLDFNNIIIVPGNHDADWSVSKAAYKLMRREEYTGPVHEEAIFDDKKSNYIEVCDIDEYKKRFLNFSNLYSYLRGRAYPLEYGDQYDLQAFDGQELLFLGLNSAWQLDHHYTNRAGMHNHALNSALFRLRENSHYQNYLKVAVWHHPLNGSGDDRIRDHGFAERLAKAGFKIGLHGHVHETEAGSFRYEVGPQGRGLEIVSAGTFGAPTRGLPTGTPWQYNLLRFNGNEMVVETRGRKKITSPWGPYAQWVYGSGADPVSKYKIFLSKGPHRKPPPREGLRTKRELDLYLEREAYNTEGYRIALEAHIFDARGRVLLQERGIKCRDEVGKLEGVGGELRNKEDLHEALTEKIHRELGNSVVVQIDHLLEVRPVRFIENNKGPQDWFIVSYLCKLIEGVPESPDPGIVAALRFFTLDELFDLEDQTLSRSTSRARMLYKAKFGNRPYYEIMEIS